jgi:hypothetical protein
MTRTHAVLTATDKHSPTEWTAGQLPLHTACANSRDSRVRMPSSLIHASPVRAMSGPATVAERPSCSKSTTM